MRRLVSDLLLVGQVSRSKTAQSHTPPFKERQENPFLGSAAAAGLLMQRYHPHRDHKMWSDLGGSHG